MPVLPEGYKKAQAEKTGGGIPTPLQQETKVQVTREIHRRTLPLSLRKQRYEDLCRLVKACVACPRMDGRRRVLSRLNGNPNSLIMFVAEAPGRNGADRTGVPIHGDPSGNNFEKLLAHIGLDRNDVFVTNAVLCNPRDDKGNNSTPNSLELSNCSFHLKSTLDVVEPIIICTMGAQPLAALELIEPHGLTLSSAVAKPHYWAHRILYPLYHPSPRALLHRSFATQQNDFNGLLDLLQDLRDNKSVQMP